MSIMIPTLALLSVSGSVLTGDFSATQEFNVNDNTELSITLDGNTQTGEASAISLDLYTTLPSDIGLSVSLSEDIAYDEQELDLSFTKSFGDFNTSFNVSEYNDEDGLSDPSWNVAVHKNLIEYKGFSVDVTQSYGTYGHDTDVSFDYSYDFSE